jgi:ADP-sugar diphosphatase
MIHLVAEIYDEAGKRLPGAVFLRGYTVDVLTIISDGNREYVVLVNQPRVAVGGLVLSNPSGMIDGHEGVAVAATRELEEEVGGGIDWQLPCPLDSSIMGNGAPWLVSPGGSDETVSFFVVRGHVSSTQMAQLDGRVAGLTSENEATTVVLVPLNEVPQRLAATGKPDLKTLTAWLLYRYQQPARG